MMSRPHNDHVKTARRVLIVDDNSDFSASLDDLLGLRGYNIATAETPDGAMQLITDFDPTVVLIDIRLRLFLGVDYLARLARDYPDIVCIMMAAYADTETAIA